MTEAEWLACDDPRWILEHLRGKASARKMRLLAVACCRRIYHVLTDPRSRHLVDLIEQTADDSSLKDHWQPLVDLAKQAIHETFGPITGHRVELEELLTDARGACVVVLFLLWRTEGAAFLDTATVMRYAASR